MFDMHANVKHFLTKWIALNDAPIVLLSCAFCNFALWGASLFWDVLIAALKPLRPMNGRINGWKLLTVRGQLEFFFFFLNGKESHSFIGCVHNVRVKNGKNLSGVWEEPDWPEKIRPVCWSASEPKFRSSELSMKPPFIGRRWMPCELSRFDSSEQQKRSQQANWWSPLFESQRKLCRTAVRQKQ